MYDLKVNYNATPKLAVWGKYSRMDAPVDGRYRVRRPGGAHARHRRLSATTHVQLPTVGFTYTFSPTFLMDGMFGYTRFEQDVTGRTTDKNVRPGRVGHSRAPTAARQYKTTQALQRSCRTHRVRFQLLGRRRYLDAAASATSAPTNSGPTSARSTARTSCAGASSRGGWRWTHWQPETAESARRHQFRERCDHDSGPNQYDRAEQLRRRHCWGWSAAITSPCSTCS